MIHFNEEDERTVFVRNIDDKVSKEILEELFVQMGAVEKVIIKESKPFSNSAYKNKFAFVEFKDVESVLFAVEMLDEVSLFGKKITVAPRDKSKQAEKYKELREQFIANRSNNDNARIEQNSSQSGSNYRHSRNQASANKFNFYNRNDANATTCDSANNYDSPSNFNKQHIASLMSLPPPPIPPSLTENLKKTNNFDEIVLRNHMELALNDLSSDRNLNTLQFEKNYRGNSQQHRHSLPYDKHSSSATFLSNKSNKNKLRNSKHNYE